MIKLVSTCPSDWGTEEERNTEDGMGYVYLTRRGGGVLEVHAVHYRLPPAPPHVHYADGEVGEGEVVTDLPRIAGWLGWSPTTFEELALARLDAVAEEEAAFAYAVATYDRPRGW